MRAPVVDIDELAPGTIAIFGVPFEVSTSICARFGPKVIRE